MSTSNSSGERRRFYVASPDFNHNPSDFSFVNKDEALVNGRMSGTHEHQIEGGGITRVGLPPLEARPKLVIAAENKAQLDIYGLRLHFVSSRLRDLLMEIDPTAFEFAECDTVDGSGVPVAPYWMMDVTRVIRSFDEERSNFQRFVDAYPTDPTASRNPSILKLNDIYMDSDFPPDAHAFYLLRYRRDFIVDEAIKDGWKRKKLIGLVFSPLQPPTAEELKDSSNFVNFPYWKR